MRPAVAFFLTFVTILTVGMLTLPDTPKIKPKRPIGSAPVAPRLDFLPEPPSLVAPVLEDASKRREAARRLLKAGRYSAAEGAYLNILMQSPEDQEATQGLVTLRRLLANQDPEKLRAQAGDYRHAIAQGTTTEEQYTPRELELLAEASLSAANEIAAETGLKVSSLSNASMTSGLAPPTSVPAPKVIQDPMGAIKDKITKAISSLELPPAKTGAAGGGNTKLSSKKETVVAIPLAGKSYPAPKSIGQMPVSSSPAEENLLDTTPGATLKGETPGNAVPPSAGSATDQPDTKDSATTGPNSKDSQSGGGTPPPDPPKIKGGEGSERDSSGTSGNGGSGNGSGGTNGGSSGSGSQGGGGTGSGGSGSGKGGSGDGKKK